MIRAILFWVALLILPSALIVVLVFGVQAPVTVQTVIPAHRERGLHIDPLGKFRSPGRCVGWVCF